MTARRLAAVTLALLGIPLLAAAEPRIQLDVDARESSRHVLHARLTIPVAPGPLTGYAPDSYSGWNATARVDGIVQGVVVQISIETGRPALSV